MKKNKKLRILVACEESQAVTIELRKLGHEAYSNDIIECSGEHPEWHIQKSTLDIMNNGWDMIIAFPPCTYLTVTGNRWFNIERYGEKAIQRHKDREWAVDFFKAIYNSDCEKVAIENPVGVMSTLFKKPNQIVNPFQFGDAFEKKTCLWLKGLDKLEYTDVVTPPKRTEFASGKTMPSWYADAWRLPKEERAKLRSKTFPGIAKAMAEQWAGKVN